jgi:hypothetical protein
MATRRPANAIVERGVLLEDAAREAELIQDLTGLLPDDLESHVSAFLSGNLTTDVRASVGDPTLIVEHLAHWASESGAHLDQAKLTGAIGATLRDLGGDSGATVDRAVVAEETAHARSALVKYWLSVLLTAWDLWDHPTDGITLDQGTLLPGGKCPQQDSWREAKAALREALVCNVALNAERDVPWALHALAANAYVRTAAQALNLPRGLVLQRMGREVRLREDAASQRLRDRGAAL